MNSCRLRFFLLLMLMGSLVSACSPVAPWQRAHLAQLTMALEPNPLQSSLRNHHYGSREGAISSHSASGGGCGCY